jgi:hypothetical protein
MRLKPTRSAIFELLSLLRCAAVIAPDWMLRESRDPKGSRFYMQEQSRIDRDQS